MLARLHSVTLEGIDGIVCEVEVDIARSGYDKPIIVGLPDTAVKESTERVRSAITNSGFTYPETKCLINLAPADIKKAGVGFDLPIALGMLRCSGVFDSDILRQCVIVGELALDGRIRPVDGLLSMAASAVKKGFSKMIVPLENAAEAAIVQNIDVYGAGSLAQAVGMLSGQIEMEPTTVNIDEMFRHEQEKADIDFSDVKGQRAVKRALTIAAAGGHNILMLGSPGAGKSMMCQRLGGILPPLTLAEAIETTRIYSSVGQLGDTPLITQRPVRMPHHTASGPALIGGGTIPRPGQLSMSHNGILFLDEFAEFPRNVLEMIRQPLEDGQVNVSRAKSSITFPARFMLVAAMNPCPCGFFGTDRRKCKCSPNQVHKYMSKISGPLMDRIDIHIDVPAVKFENLRSTKSEETTATIRENVASARDIQTNRFGKNNLTTNATMTHKQLQKACELDESSVQLLKQAMHEFSLSARAHDKICKVARTIADLEGIENIQPEHLAEAISYRKLDRSL